MRIIPHANESLIAVANGLRRKAARKGELTVIAARRETGKSRLINEIVDALWQDDIAIVYVLQHAAFGEFLYFSELPSLFPHRDSEEDYFFMHAKSISLPVLMAALKLVHEERPIGLIAIDGLEVLANAATAQDRTWQIQDLKNLAKDFNATLLLTAELPHEMGPAATRCPTLEELASIFYPGLADTVVFLYDTGTKNEIGDRTHRATIAKNSSGQTADYDYLMLRSTL